MYIHKPGRIKSGRIKRAALSLRNQNNYMFAFWCDPVRMPLKAHPECAVAARQLSGMYIYIYIYINNDNDNIYIYIYIY